MVFLCYSQGRAFRLTNSHICFRLHACTPIHTRSASEVGYKDHFTNHMLDYSFNAKLNRINMYIFELERHATFVYYNTNPLSGEDLRFCQPKKEKQSSKTTHWWLKLHTKPTDIEGHLFYRAIQILIITQFKLLLLHTVTCHCQLLISNSKWIMAPVNHVQRASGSLCTFTWLGKPRHGSGCPKYFDSTSHPPEDLRSVLFSLFVASVHQDSARVAKASIVCTFLCRRTFGMNVSL